jgi:hypothetical protein
MKKLLTFCLVCLMIGSAVILGLARQNDTSLAADTSQFRAGNIMSDSVMSNKTAINEAEINNFLHSKGSCNDRDRAKYDRYTAAGYQYSWRDGHFVCMADESFDGESAAHIIWQAGQDYNINPQVLIVLLQKEQGLVTDSWPNWNSQYRSATGYGCPDTAACDSQYYGFKNQVRNAARFFRGHLDNNRAWVWTYDVGWNDILLHPHYSDRVSVYIENKATAALYIYTPYTPNQAALNAGYGTGDAKSSYGNRNFWLYFTDWFGSATSPTGNIWFPNGLYRLTTPNNKSLDVAGSGVANGTDVRIWDSNNSGAQSWLVTRLSDGFYTLKNPNSDKFLDVAGGSPANGTDVWIWSGNSTCAQKWAIVTDGDGYSLLSACSGRALDVADGASANGTDVRVWDRNGSGAQRWKAVKL